MAYDKVVDSSMLDAGLLQIADAIREKAESSDSFDFPDGIAEAIAGIETNDNVLFGTYTTANDTSRIVIQHNRGAIPKIILLVCKDTNGGKTHINYAIAKNNGLWTGIYDYVIDQFASYNSFANVEYGGSDNRVCVANEEYARFGNYTSTICALAGQTYNYILYWDE